MNKAINPNTENTRLSRVRFLYNDPNPRAFTAITNDLRFSTILGWYTHILRQHAKSSDSMLKEFDLCEFIPDGLALIDPESIYRVEVQVLDVKVVEELEYES